MIIPFGFLNKQSSAPAVYNTVIGGIGATTTTAGALETLLGLSGGDVTDFSITDDNISCNIGISYTIPASAFLDNNSSIEAI